MTTPVRNCNSRPLSGFRSAAELLKDIRGQERCIARQSKKPFQVLTTRPVEGSKQASQRPLYIRAIKYTLARLLLHLCRLPNAQNGRHMPGVHKINHGIDQSAPAE
jgi:hypothetical protein